MDIIVRDDRQTIEIQFINSSLIGLTLVLKGMKVPGALEATEDAEVSGAVGLDSLHCTFAVAREGPQVSVATGSR
jgi:hypothetical protein